LNGQFQVGRPENDDQIRRQLREVAPHAFTAKYAANGARAEAAEAPRRAGRALPAAE
jgi:hypothetical protein